MKTGKGRVTMVDVAREAGVALGTVSKVINRQPVGDKYRKKVERAVNRLGYQYNVHGRTLRTDRTDTIAVIIPNTINPFFAKLVHFLNLALEKRGKRMMLSFTEYDTSRESEYIELAQQNRVDGIIALTYNPELLIPEEIPFVTIDRFFSSSVPCVAADNFGGGAMAARKLKDLGCRKAAMLFTCSTLTNEPSKRKTGFVSGCLETGLEYEVLAVSSDDPIREYTGFLRDHMRDGRLEYDGLFVGTDMQAWQVIRELGQMGIRTPEDVQVIGFDGIEMFGSLGCIVSTIVQPVKEMAETCVNAVLSKQFANQPSLILLPVTYAAGGSTRE